MKVTVSFGCDLEDVPNNIANLLDILVNDDLREAQKLIEEAAEECSQTNASRALEVVDKTRRNLAKIDERLMDYAIILNGYIKTNADMNTGVFEAQQAMQGTQEVVPQDVLSVEGIDVDIEEAEETNDQAS
tara:strand:+ start:2477 stop:2869 length:393 start_codon:yes stop_codon:yes gene_type:complete